MSGAEPAPGARRVEPRLVAVTDRNVAGGSETLRRFERVARAARSWSVMFQLRDHELDVRERLTFGRELVAMCRAEEQWFQVNDRCDLALLLGADALHLGEASVSVADARRLVGERMFVSRARHDAGGALESGVDAWVLSPIFEPRKGRGALGVEAVTRFARRATGASGASGASQVIALGGVNAANAGECLAGGATGVAVIGAVLSAPEPEALVSALGVCR
jgi:thiamine-phosphate pyrophosphorylase